jgi:WD40 repeat protein
VDDAQPVLDLELEDDARLTFAAGATLVVGLGSGDVHLHDVAAGTSRHLPRGPRIVGGVDVDPAGELLAAITDNGCAVRRLSDGAEQWAVAQDFRISRCSFSLDGRYLAVASDDSAAIVDATDGSILFTSTALGRVSDCRLLDRTRLLYTSDWDCGLVVRDMEGDRAVTFEGHTYTANCCAVAGDGITALSGGGDDTVRLWSLAEQVAPIRPDRHTELVYGVATDAGATLACSAPQDDVPAVWDARTGMRLRPLPEAVSYGYVRFCRFGGGSRIAALGTTLRLYDPDTAECVWEADIPARDEYGEVSWLDSGTFEGSHSGNDNAPRGELPLIYAGTKVIVWREGSGLEAVTVLKDAQVTRLDRGRALATLHEGVVEVIDLDGASRGRRKVAEGIAALAGSPGTRALYVLTAESRICRMDAASGKVTAVLGEVEAGPATLLVDPEETAVWVARTEARAAYRFAAPTNETLAAFASDGSGLVQQADITGHQVFGSCFVSGMLVSAGWDATVRIWDAHQPMPLATISGSSPFRCVDAAGDRIVAGDQKGNVWFLAPMSELYP